MRHRSRKHIDNNHTRDDKNHSNNRSHIRHLPEHDGTNNGYEDDAHARP